MSVHSVQNSQAAAQTEAVAQAQSTAKQASQNTPLPEDTVTISAEAQAKQIASSIGAVLGKNGSK